MLFVQEMLCESMLIIPDLMLVVQEMLCESMGIIQDLNIVTEFYLDIIFDC
jgi:hypothetical protein